MIEGFDSFDAPGDGATIHGAIGGSGPPLLLLHGYPQTHMMWGKVAPALAKHFTVIAADLRGYGASSKPSTTPDHAPYSKRAMARDMVAVMAHFGHTRFQVAGHDRGGRVAHRLASDWPERVTRLAVLDIAPTREMYAGTTDAFARAYWHWFFLIQPAPFPEMMIGANTDAYWKHKCGSGSAGLTPFTPAALQSYLEAFRNPATVHASCEDYRAAVTIDLAHDDADSGKLLDCPVLALWGRTGAIERHFDCLALWRTRARDVRGEALDGGHYLAEECPERVTEEFMRFFNKDPDQ
jgi:haloacetate dehalogenase